MQSPRKWQTMRLLNSYIQNKQNLKMTNNDILRRLRYVFDFNDAKMIEIFALADVDVRR
ncbi:MAG: DUF1456 family protein, partial [Pseudomonadales bacterium]